MGRKTPSGKAAMEATDEKDPALIPSLPEPWEGLVRDALSTVVEARWAEWTGDFPDITDARHEASRAERALRVNLLALLAGSEKPAAS